MFNQLVKWTALLTIWRKFKHHILATIALLLLFFITSTVHSDYLAYANAAEQRDIAGSFFIKWGLNLTYVVVYIVVLFQLNKKPTKIKTKMSESSEDKKVRQTSEKRSDPFDKIRKKKKLRSNADITISKVRVKKR